jgi:hypothetical protein
VFLAVAPAVSSSSTGYSNTTLSGSFAANQRFFGVEDDQIGFLVALGFLRKMNPNVFHLVARPAPL